jgi:hypothetical protein
MRRPPLKRARRRRVSNPYGTRVPSSLVAPRCITAGNSEIDGVAPRRGSRAASSLRPGESCHAFIAVNPIQRLEGTALGGTGPQAERERSRDQTGGH